MKRLAVLTIVTILATATLAFAQMGSGPMTGMNANCPLMGTSSPEQAQKVAQFQQDILPLKQKMLQLRTELMALRAASNLDWKAIADKQKQMVDVRVEIQKKSVAAGFPAAGMGMGMRGMGMQKCGMMGGGMGMMGGGMGTMASPNCPLANPSAASAPAK